MNNKKASFEHYEKYEKMFKMKGMQYVPFSKEEIETALKNGDEHLNTLPLIKWDMAAVHVGYTRIGENGKKYFSLADQVCLLKHIAIYHIAEGTPIPSNDEPIGEVFEIDTDNQTI